MTFSDFERNYIFIGVIFNEVAKIQKKFNL
jgi:hypothetical protein